MIIVCVNGAYSSKKAMLIKNLQNVGFSKLVHYTSDRNEVSSWNDIKFVNDEQFNGLNQYKCILETTQEGSMTRSGIQLPMGQEMSCCHAYKCEIDALKEKFGTQVIEVEISDTDSKINTSADVVFSDEETTLTMVAHIIEKYKQTNKNKV